MNIARSTLKVSMLAVSLTAVLAACSSEDPLLEGRKGSRSNITNRWEPPESNATGTYEGLNGEGCSGGLKPGTRQLGDQLKSQFNTSYGGYACRANTANKSQLSIHAIGRALDINASGSAGDEIANHLVNNAEAFGIQLIIWNRTVWRIGPSGPTSRQYTGPNPHTDHVHAEVSTAIASSGPGEGTGMPDDQEPNGSDPNGNDPNGNDPNGNDPNGNDPNDPWWDPSMGDDEMECRTDADCDPSGYVMCDQGYCWW